MNSRISFTLERYRDHVAWSAWYGAMAAHHVIEDGISPNMVHTELAVQYACYAWHQAKAAVRVEFELNEEIALFLQAEYDRGLQDGMYGKHTLGR